MEFIAVYGGRATAARAEWEVYIGGGRLAYLKEFCGAGDGGAGFYLQIIPRDRADLPGGFCIICWVVRKRRQRGVITQMELAHMRWDKVSLDVLGISDSPKKFLAATQETEPAWRLRRDGLG